MTTPLSFFVARRSSSRGTPCSWFTDPSRKIGSCPGGVRGRMRAPWPAHAGRSERRPASRSTPAAARRARHHRSEWTPPHYRSGVSLARPTHGPACRFGTRSGTGLRVIGSARRVDHASAAGRAPPSCARPSRPHGAVPGEHVAASRRGGPMRGHARVPCPVVRQRCPGDRTCRRPCSNPPCRSSATGR